MGVARQDAAPAAIRVSPLLRSCSMGTPKERADQKRPRRPVCLVSGSVTPPIRCGSEPAREGITAVYQKDRVACFASRLAPTKKGCCLKSGYCLCLTGSRVSTGVVSACESQWLCGRCSNRVLHTPAMCSSSSTTASSTSPARQASRICRCSWSARCLPADKLIWMRR